MKFLAVEWFTNKDGTVGIVKVDTGFEIKYYISKVAGIDQTEDIQYIMSWGCKFPDSAGEALFK